MQQFFQSKYHEPNYDNHHYYQQQHSPNVNQSLTPASSAQTPAATTTQTAQTASQALGATLEAKPLAKIFTSHHQVDGIMSTNQQHSNLSRAFDVDMDATLIDENMTVPHPSRHQTTTSLAESTLDAHHCSANQSQLTTAQIQPPHSYQNQHQHNNHHLHQPNNHHHHHNQHHQHQMMQQQTQIYQQQQQPQQPQHHQQQQQQHQHVHQQQLLQQQSPIGEQYHQQAPSNQMMEPQDDLSLKKMIQDDYLTKSLKDILFRTQQNSEILNMGCRHAHQELNLTLQDMNKLLSSKTHYQKAGDVVNLEKCQVETGICKARVQEQAGNVNSLRCGLIDNLKKIFQESYQIQQQILDHYLPFWHREQQLANNSSLSPGKSDDITAYLDKLQEWIEIIVEILWKARKQLLTLHLQITSKPQFAMPSTQKPFLDDLNNLGFSIDKSLETLVLNTFVVEKQPPQVMKTNTRFTSTVRFLGSDKLNIHMQTPNVKVTILSESNARAIIQRHQQLINMSWSNLQNDQQLHQQHLNNLHRDDRMTPKIAQSLTPGHLVYSNPPLDDQNHMIDMDDTLSPIAPQSIHSASPSQHNLHHYQQQEQSFFQQQHQQRQSFQMQQQQQQSQPPMASTSPYSLHQTQHGVIGNIAYYRNKVLNINDFEPSGEIINNSNILEYQESTRQLSCHFRNMQLKKIKRTEKKGTESVMDEKFVLFFHAEFRIPGNRPSDDSCSEPIPWVRVGDLSFPLMAFSLPVVVIVHGNQEPHAWATVTWHNAFAAPDNLLYQVPEKVSWHELGHVLSEKFRTCAGRGLSKNNLDYLTTKVARGPVDSDDVIITWNLFAKEPLPERNFTFWEWFHSILKLTKEHLRELWNDERIYGFVGKQNCVDLLLGSHYHEARIHGTFLLRYSETELGGITIAWVSPSSNTSSKNNRVQVMQRNSPTNPSTNVLMHLQPFVSKDLNTRSLADRVRDLEDLVYLFPDIPKDNAFKAYFTPLTDATQQANGYVKPMLIQTLVTNYPKSSGNSLDVNICTPATPNSTSQSSPDGYTPQENTFLAEIDGYPANFGPIVNEFNKTLH